MDDAKNLATLSGQLGRSPPSSHRSEPNGWKFTANWRTPSSCKCLVLFREYSPLETRECQCALGSQTWSSEVLPNLQRRCRHAIEALTVIASPGAAVRQVARSSINPFSFARTCYDHLAGKLGVRTRHPAQQAHAYQSEAHVTKRDINVHDGIRKLISVSLDYNGAARRTIVGNGENQVRPFR